jgi:hypothetical protein
MPFVPFHSGSTTVPKKTPTPAKPTVKRTPKPAGAGPAGKPGFFHN